MKNVAMGAICVIALGVSCSSYAAGFKHENKPENLRALFSAIHQETHARKNLKQAAEMMQAVMPDEARLKKAMRDNVNADALRRIVTLHKAMPAITEKEMVRIARPEQKNVQVYGARTEEIVAYKEGSVAFKEFPGGARKVAEQVLRPGMTFYEVAFLEPGKDSGMKYHLFYWDGKQWSMLGPIWRALDSK